PREQLAQIRRAAADVAADEVRVRSFHFRAIADVPRQDALAEAGRKALDLLFDALGHVESRRVGNVAVGPGDMFTCGRAAFVEQTRLGEQDERTFGRFALGDFAL